MSNRPTSPPISRLALGTVQFGLDYGATNRAGRVGRDEARALLLLARDAGIAILDTAPAYGEAETVLGALGDVTVGFRIVTKTWPLAGPEITAEGVAQVAAAIGQSIARLRRRPLDVLLVHHAGNLLSPGGDRLLARLIAAKADGEAARIGVSVYDPAELEAILALFMPDVVQLPFNLVDQRFRAAGQLARLASLGVEVHARSLFLQGTLLADADALPGHLAALRPAVEAVGAFAATHGMSRLAACLGFGLANPEIAALVVGATSAAELGEIVAAAGAAPAAFPDAVRLACEDVSVINPSRWPRA